LQGWGIVEFEKPEEAAAAIQQLDRSEVRLAAHCLACKMYLQKGIFCIFEMT